MTDAQLEKLKAKIIPLAESHKLNYVAIFGSHARNEATEDSDIDLLVKFSEPINFINFVELEETFSKSLNKKVDLVTEESLSVHLKPYVIKDLKVLYER